MSKKDCKLTVQRLHQVLDYNKETGVFVWKHRDTHKDKIGKVAAIKRPHGYLAICIDSQYYYTHRLAWLYVYGEWPEVIDHIDGNKDNNQIENLRSVSQSCNVQNVLKARRHNSMGLLGVHKTKSGYSSALGFDGKRIYLGHYKNPEDAHNAYINAKRKYHDGCTI